MSPPESAKNPLICTADAGAQRYKVRPDMREKIPPEAARRLTFPFTHGGAYNGEHLIRPDPALQRALRVTGKSKRAAAFQPDDPVKDICAAVALVQNDVAGA